VQIYLLNIIGLCVRAFASDFRSDEQGQDLTEYALLLAFVVVVSAAVFVTNMSAMAGIWERTNNIVSAASARISDS
jgi:Flp pilus assembly pilin Flp